jgi:predicted PurR-regulated permease PerM
MNPDRDLTRTLLTIIFLLALLAACGWILRPFFMPILWASMIVVATWPLMERLQRLLWGRRWLAVTVMALALLVLFIAPILTAVVTVVDNHARILDWGRSLLVLAPDWLARLPLFGDDLASAWLEITGSSPDELGGRLAPYADAAVQWLGAQTGSIGLIFIQFFLTFLVAVFLYLRGELAVGLVQGFARRMAGDRGVQVTVLAGQAIRAVALGVIVTAAVQALLAAIGLAVCGVPFVSVLTAIVFFFCLAQIGPAPILAPAVFWLFWKGQPGWGTALLVWTVLICSLDNVLRAYLIRLGADLPLVLILTGVIGGLVAFGIIGIFIGPVVLVTAYALFDAWVAETPLAEETDVAGK